MKEDYLIINTQAKGYVSAMYGTSTDVKFAKMFTSKEANAFCEQHNTKGKFISFIPISLKYVEPWL